MISERHLGRVAIILVVLLIAVPVGVTFLNQSSSSQVSNLDLSISGSIANAGNQGYSTSGGALVSGSVLNYTLFPSTARFSFDFKANVSGLSTFGYSALNLSGSTIDGKTNVTLYARGEINDSIFAAEFPNGCSTACKSEIPAAFVSMDLVNASIKTGKNNVTTTSWKSPVVFESPYLNPFGAPIVISGGSAFEIASTYSSAKILWNDVMMKGVINGSMSTNTTQVNDMVRGVFGLNTTAREDLVSGVEVENGTMSFSKMNIAELDSRGSFVGSSMIPFNGTLSCPSLLGFPAGTCLETGLKSGGNISLSNAHADISGRYLTSWSVPALNYSGNVTGTMSKE